MDSKRLNWTYGDDYFSKKSNVFEKVFQESPPKLPDQGDELSNLVNTELLDYDTEDYETLRNNLVYTVDGSTEIPRVISITCCNFGEGATTVATNLAITFAKHADGSVLFVDANFPNPSAHSIFGVNQSPGLGEILLDGLEYTAAIQPSIINNLFVLTTGNKNVNPNPQFDSPLFTDLLQQWRLEYKFIIFDTPPMQCDMKQCDMNFPIHLASLVDGNILVIETEGVRWEVAVRVKERLLQSNAKILGVVLNKRKYYIPKWLYKTL